MSSYARSRLLLLILVLMRAGASVASAQHAFDRPPAVDDRVVRLADRAFDALRAGRAQEAADAFRELTAAFPKEPLVHLGAAQAAYLLGQDASARQALETVLQLAPDLGIARFFLGQVLHRTGELDEAVRTFETLAAQAPEDAGIAATLARWRKEAEVHGRMRQSVGTHFTVSFEGPSEAALAARALESLESAYWRIAQLLAVYPERPIDVVLYTQEQFKDITRSPGWAAAAYDGTIRVPIRGALEKDPAELNRVLAHEFTHALIHTLARQGVPLWLQEGLATALESDDLTWAGKALAATGAVPLESLEAGFNGTSSAAATRSYAMSGLAGLHLIEDAGGPAIGALLGDLGSGVPFPDAFATRVLQSFTDFQARLAEAYPKAPE